MRAKRRSRVKAAAPNARCDFLREYPHLRAPLFDFGAYRGGRTHENPAPRGQLLLRRDRLPGEDALLVPFNDQAGRDVPRGAAIDARAVDVPVPGSGVRVADRLQSIGSMLGFVHVDAFLQVYRNMSGVIGPGTLRA